MTKRKKYIDELDIQLSDEDRSADEDSVVVDANDYVNGIPMDQPPRDIFVVFISHITVCFLDISAHVLNVEELWYLHYGTFMIVCSFFIYQPKTIKCGTYILHYNLRLDDGISVWCY